MPPKDDFKNMEINKTDDDLAKAKLLFSEKQYGEAIDLLVEMETEKILHPKVLVLKYLCMAMIENRKYSLDESEKVLNQALKLDSDYIPAIVELGYLKLNILDKPKEAIVLFEKATIMLNDLVSEVILGHAQCIAELDSPKSAIDFLGKQKKELINPEKLQEFINDINDSYAV